jgi:tetratricopeptide (TPR) repeat protein
MKRKKIMKSEDILFFLGVLYEKASMHNESITSMESVLKINKNNANALNFIGYTLADKGIQLPRAKKMIKKALHLKPEDGYITDSLGWVYYKMGKYRKAIKVLEKAVEIVPQDPIIAEHLGDAYLANNSKLKAVKMYEKALELDPMNKSILVKIREVEELLR